MNLSEEQKQELIRILNNSINEMEMAIDAEYMRYEGHRGYNEFVEYFQGCRHTTITDAMKFVELLEAKTE